MSKLLKDRYRNPWFWVGLVSIMIAASGIDFETLTSWALVGQALLTIVMNPVKLVAVLLAGLGVFINPTTKGVKD
jgi:phi LC3 family holin